MTATVTLSSWPDAATPSALDIERPALFGVQLEASVLWSAFAWIAQKTRPDRERTVVPYDELMSESRAQTHC
jgi:hypothetical protein